MNNNDNAWTDALDHLYGAVGKPELWTVALDSLCELLNAHSALIFTPCPQLLDMPHHWSSRYSPETIKDYLENFVLEDPYNVAASSRGLFKMGLVVTGDQLVPMSHLKKTRFFNDFSIKHNQGQLLASLPFWVDNSHDLPAIVLSFYRPVHHPAFLETEANLLNKLLPHVQRAWLLHDQLEKYKTLNSALTSALNQLSHGVMIITPKGAMRFANTSAKRFLSDIYLSELKNKKSNRIGLPASVLDVMAIVAREKISCKKVLLNQNEEWFVVAVSIKNLSHLQEEGDSDDVVVWLTKNDQKCKTSIDLIAELFNLTLTEGKVLESLLKNQTPQQISEMLGVKISTVRSHITALLLKTNSNRQQDLIRLASSFTFL